MPANIKVAYKQFMKVISYENISAQDGKEDRKRKSKGTRIF